MIEFLVAPFVWSAQRRRLRAAEARRRELLAEQRRLALIRALRRLR